VGVYGQKVRERLSAIAQHLRPAVFLDRDGVLNHVVMRGTKSYPPPTAEEYRFLPGVPEAARVLREAGFLLVVATNQPDVGNGIQKQSVVEQMHDIVRTQLLVDDIEVCYHTREDRCTCRKPLPGMLVSAAKKWSIDLSRSFMVGDRWTDVAAGKAAGCKTFLIGHGYAEEMITDEPEWRVDSLFEASEILIAQGANQK